MNCVTQGIVIVGGMPANDKSPGNHTEIVDPFAKHKICKDFELPDFPSRDGRYGMVGSYIGKETVVFCGGTEKIDYIDKVQQDCFRYQNLLDDYC